MKASRHTLIHEKKRAEIQAVRFGIDLTLLEASLHRSPLQRIRLHDRAYREMKRLQAAGKIARGGL